MKRFLPFLMLLCTLFAGAEEEIEDTRTLPLLNPTYAEVETAKIRLDNGLEAFIISDPNTTESGAVLSVNAGSWSDPEKALGTAHFVEHMLFQGTEKYPNEGEYFRYIRDHGGIANAFTASDQTSYIFTVNNSAFEGAVDRFSSFFTSPLFNPSGVSRELNAIDQEYGKNLENDMLRVYHIHKSLGNPDHPESRFTMGNSRSLANTSPEELRRWYQDHYSANLMRLVVISSMPMEELRPLIIEKFSPIPNKDLSAYKPKEPATSPKASQQIVYLPPVQDIRKLFIAWELPQKFAGMIDSSPDDIVCHLLGHEGEKSLLSELKRAGLAESIACGGFKVGGNNIELFLDIGLTDKGVGSWNEVLLALFQAIGEFKSSPVPDYMFREIKMNDETLYQHQSRKKLFFDLMGHAQKMLKEPMSSYPEKSHVVQSFNPEAVQELLSELTPEKAYIFLAAPESLTGKTPDQMEKWLNVPYKVEPIAQETLQAWRNAGKNPRIGYPQPNPFMSEAPEILSKPIQPEAILPPVKTLIQNDLAELYYAPDDRFGEPEISFLLKVRTPAITESDPKSVVMADIYLKAVKEALLPISYPAQIAGLDFSIERSYNGVDIMVWGLSEKAPLLFEKVLEAVKNPSLKEEDFNVFKESLERKWRSFANERPIKQVTEALKEVIYQDFVTPEEKLDALKNVSYETMQSFIGSLFVQTYLQGVFTGNISREDAEREVENTLAAFPGGVYPKEERYERKVIDLPSEKGPFYIIKTTPSQGNAALLAIESIPFSMQERGAQQILMEGMSEPFFTELRTKQQTGYIVFSSGEEIEKHLFNLFAIQSNSHDPRDLLARFELFIERFLQELEVESLTEERFEKIKASVIQEIKTAVKNVEQMGKLIQLLVAEYDADFAWMEKRVEALESLDYKTFAAIVKEKMGKGNKQRAGILLEGQVPELNRLRYIEAPSIKKLQEISSFSF